MKKKFIVMLFCVMLSLTAVGATPFSSQLPGGKNYLDVNNMEYDGSSLSTIDPIRVRPNTTYTLRVPPAEFFGDTMVIVTSSSGSYIDGEVATDPSCVVEPEYSYCTFTTSSSEYLNVYIEGGRIAQFLDYYGFVDFQLEEGSLPTSYEEYIAPSTDVTDPTFDGSATFIKAYYEDISTQQIIDNHILAYDDIDGDLTDSIVVTNDTYSANKYTVGEYVIDMEVADTSGNTATYQLNVVVKDEVAPLIDGPSSITIDVNNHPLIDDVIAANYFINDGHDGSIIPTYPIDQYTENKYDVGSYDVTISAIDASGNEATKSIVLHVVDTEAPSLISSTQITIPISSPQSTSEIINGLTITDNYDNTDGITTSILTDGYITNETTVGTYQIEISISDSSNNSLTTVLYVTIVDDVAPLLDGPNTMQTSYTTAFTLQDLIDQLTVSDNYDTITSEDLVIIQDTYTNRISDVGTYEITFEVQDTSNNSTTHTIVITLIDDQAPMIYIDNYLITVSSEIQFSPNDALNILIKNNELTDEQYRIITILDEYSGNEDIPGTYAYRLKFIDDNGSELEKEFLIKVTDVEEESSHITSYLRSGIVYTVTFGFIIFVVMKRQK